MSTSRIVRELDYVRREAKTQLRTKRCRFWTDTHLTDNQHRTRRPMQNPVGHAPQKQPFKIGKPP